MLLGMLFLVAQAAMGTGVAQAAAPTASVGGDYSGDEGAQIPFFGDASDIEDSSNQLTYQWDFDRQAAFTIDATGVNLTSTTHVYTDDGNFIVSLRVVDTDSNVSSESTATVTVANVPPSSDAGGPYNVDEGSSLTFTGSATDPGQDTLTFEWDFTYDGATFNVDASGDDLTGPSNTYPNDGAFTVALRVRDDDGGVGSIQSVAVTVNNVPPTANAGTTYTGDEGSVINFTGTATDPGSDTLTYEWDFTFGAAFQIDASGDGLTSPTHTYTNDGDFTVALRVRDDDTVSPNATAAVTISNVLPTPDAGGPYVVNAGTSLTFSGSATDPGDDTLTYEWDFEYDGVTFDTSGPTTDFGVDLTSPSYTYSADAVYNVALRVRDDDGNSAVVTAQVTVNPSGATPTPTALVPSVSEWGLVATAMLLAAAFLWRARRRRLALPQD